MVSKKILNEMHLVSWFVLALGAFFIAVPYIYKVSDFNLIILYSIIGVVLIKVSIIFREQLRFDKII